MNEWEGNCEDRNRVALMEWKLKRTHGFSYPDHRSPRGREYFEWAHSRKLEVARSFLDRLKYLKSSK